MANGLLTINKFGGLDERNVYSHNPSLSPDMNNFTVLEDGSLKKRCGSKLCATDLNGSVYRMWRGYVNGILHFIVCAGTRIYKYDFETDSFVTINITAGKCHHIFGFGNAVYFLCNSGFFKYENNIFNLVSPYIPLVAVACAPDGSGTLYEKVNMLTGKKRMQFSPDGVSTLYTLGEKDIDSVLWVKENGNEIENWTADIQNGTVSFAQSRVPQKGLNNLEICWEKASTAKAKTITSCTDGMNFGGNTDTRVFLYGNPEYPNYRFYSELANGLPSAEYFPETNYTVIGSSTITDMVQQYDRQLIFTEDRAYYSYCELRNDSLGNYYPSFPVYNLNFEKGNLIKGSSAVIDNTPVTLSDDGLNRWVSTTVQDERNAVCFSAPISNTVKRILETGNAENCCIYDRQSTGELYFSTPYGLYIYNYKTSVWYRYDAVNAIQFCEIPGRLYWLDKDGRLYYFSEELTLDENKAVTAYWCTPVSNFGAKGRKFDLLSVTVDVDNDNGTDLTVTANPNEIGQIMNSQTVSVDRNNSLLRRFFFRTEIKRVAAAKIIVSSTHESRQADIKSITFKIKNKEVER
ncbi:MAG: hypothetical protein IKT37_03430 [Clostridia bacterium]|nr:hypothetical protein [Clostridia bacterium]